MRAVSIVRRLADGVKTGHAGTLDPLATGVLVIAVGRATKLISRLMATDKRYRTEIDLSAFTTTDDAEAPRDEVDVPRPPCADEVRAALETFVGTIQQRPPRFSAVKIGGRRAYKTARQGGEVEPEARPVTIHGIDLLRYQWPIVELDLHCAKGVYVRSLARDLGRLLKTGGYCRSIRRTAVGPFTLEQAVPVPGLPMTIEQDHLISPDEAIGILDGGS